jgi:murein DD-endopeptidase MepM/ murein hydrolase activator NlpD
MFIIVQVRIVPALEAGGLHYLSDAMKMATRHLEGIERPLPDDVILSQDLANFADRKGFEGYLTNYYQVQSCIAAADRMSVLRSQLCALMELEGGWASNEIKANTYVVAAGTAQLIYGFGYDPEDPTIKWGPKEIEIVIETQEECPEEGCDDETETEIQVIYDCLNETCEAFLNYFGDNEDVLLQFMDMSSEWRITKNAEIRPITPSNDWIRWPELVVKYLTLKNLGYAELYMVDGKIISVVDYGQAPPNDLPDIPDGTFIHPISGGGCISGNRFGRDANGNLFPQHRGTDYACGDGWVRAAHNGVVTFSSYLDESTGLAAELWSSGNQVVIQSYLPDGTLFCTGYGHGANLLVTRGQDVRAGDVVFKMGSTGLSTGDHLHFFIRIGGSGDYCTGGYFIDPETVLP